VHMGVDKIQKSARGIPIIAMLPSAPKLITYKANTNALEDILDKKVINQAFRGLAISVIGEDYQLAEIPFKD